MGGPTPVGALSAAPVAARSGGPSVAASSAPAGRGRSLPGVLLAVLLAAAALFAPAVRTPTTIAAGRVVSAVHGPATTTQGAQPDRAPAAARAGTHDGSAPGGTGAAALLPDVAWAAVLVCLGLAVGAGAGRHPSRVVTARGRAPPRVRTVLAS
jgi:hypothetical protein